MREPCPDWSPVGVNFKILDEHPYLSYISSSPPPPPPRGETARLAFLLVDANETSIERGPEFTHSIPVNTALVAFPYGVHTVFMVKVSKKTVYTP